MSKEHRGTIILFANKHSCLGIQYKLAYYKTCARQEHPNLHTMSGNAPIEEI